MADALTNFSYSTVLTPPAPASSGTSLVVQSGDGAKFPTVPFDVVVWPSGVNPLTTNAEVVRVTAISTDTLTIVRQAEGSSSRSILSGDQIGPTITAPFLGIGLRNNRPTYTFKVPAGHSAYYSGEFEIPASIDIETDADGVLEVG